MDELGDVGSVASVAESSAVTVTMPSGDENLGENMACEGQIEESCSGGDGEEIMIEVVGSDVFVDGVSGAGDGLGKEGLGEDMESFGNEGVVGGDRGSREIGDLGGQLSDGRIETGEVVAEEGVEVVPGSSIEQTNVVVSQRAEVSVRGEVEGKVQGGAELVDEGDKVPDNQSQGTDGVGDEVWNPGIDAAIVPCSPKVKPQSVQGEIVDGSKTDEEEDWNCKNEILGADVVSDSLQSSGKDESSVVKTIETISEASDKATVSHASSKILKNPAEAVVRGHVGLSTPEENLPPATGGTETNVNDQNLRFSTEGMPMKDRAADNNVSHGNMDAETLSFSELPNDTDGGGVASDDASVSLAGSLDTVGEHTLTDKNVSARSVSDIVLGTEPELSIRNTEIVELGEIAAGNIEDSGLEPEAQFSAGKKEATSRSEDFPSMKEETIFVSHGDMHAAPESSLEQSSVVERGEWIGMDIDEVLDFKDEPVIADAPDASLCSAGHTEDNSGISGKPILTPDHGDVAAKAASFGDETCVKDIKTSTNFRGDGLVQSDLGISNEHTELSTGYAEVIAKNKGANFRGEVSDGNESVQKSEQFNTLNIVEVAEKDVVTVANSVLSSEQNCKFIPMEISVNSYEAVEVPLCDARPLLKDGNEKVEKEGVSKGEDGVLCCDPKEGAEVQVHNDAVQGTDSNVEVNTSIPDQKPEVVESLMHEVHVDQTKDTFVVDEIQNEGDYTASISNVQVSTGSESAGVSEAVDKLTESKSNCSNSNDDDMMQVDNPEFKSTEDQQDIGVGKQNPEDGQLDYREQDILCEENASGMDWSKKVEEKTTKLPSLLSIHQDGYFLPPGNEGEFSITDLVWGKVRSHPWWPGQIFDPADASEKAVKYYKKDCFLVAYFGDHTFAWNDASLLKPFRPHFSHIEKQSNSEAFQNAVSCALDEVSRRVELGLSCSCIPGDAYDKLECQIVENTGIREESSRRHGVDKSTGATSFEPDKLLQYMRSLAESPFSLVDRLELVLAKAQLSAFCRFKGYREPTTFEARDATFENDARNLSSIDAVDQSVPVSNEDEQLSSSQKHKQNLKDNLHHRKERSLSELMGDMEYSPEDEEYSDGKAPTKSISTTSGKKRKAVDSLTDGDRRTTFYAAKVSTTASSPKPSFKVGDCIRRVASQLTGSAPTLKGHIDQAGTDTFPVSEDPQQGIMVVPAEISSLEEMLSQLQLAARDPKKGYGFLSNIIIFFSGFRNSVVRKHTSVGRSSGGRKRKANHTTGGYTEEFEFDDANDSYWTDRIVQNYSEEQLLQNNEHGDKNYQMVASDPNRVHKSGRGSHSRKRYSNGNHEVLADEQLEDVDRKKLELSPAELVLTFAEGDRLPSEIKLNKMFRRFGPLMESETEVDQDSHRARVIFKRGADAEVACSSAGRINIFGSMQVSYQLSYLPSTTFGALPLLMLQES